MTVTKIQTDFENNTEKFQQEIDRLAAEGNEKAKLLEPADVCFFTRNGDTWREFVESIEGWEDNTAPVFAQHPLIIEDYEESELEESELELIID